MPGKAPVSTAIQIITDMHRFILLILKFVRVIQELQFTEIFKNKAYSIRNADNYHSFSK